MTLRTTFVMFVALVLAATLGENARAVPLILDFTGFSWSTRQNGVPIAFAAIGVLDGFTPAVNDPAETYTFSLSGLANPGVISYSPSVSQYIYSGGTLSIYRSTGPSTRPYNYGTNPTGIPASFVDGALWLSGDITDLSFVYNSALKLGNFSAHGAFATGEFYPCLQDPCWSAPTAATGLPNNGIPTGYDYRLEGEATTKALAPPVPEPGPALLLGLALAGLGLARRSRRDA